MSMFNEMAEAVADQIESTADLTEFINETALALWEASDMSKETLIGLIGAVETSKQVLFKYLGDHLNDE